MNLLSAAASLLGSSAVSSVGSMFFGGGVTSLLSMGRMIFSQVAQNAVSQLGLPPFLARGLEMALESALGPGLPGNPGTMEGVIDSVADSLGLEPSEIGGTLRTLEDVLLELLTKFLEDEREDEAEEGSATGGGEGSGGAEGSSGGQGWMMRVAEAMGKIVDKEFDDMEKAVQKLTDASELSQDTGDDGEATDAAKAAEKNMPSLSVKAQGETQEFNMMMQAATNLIKTAGTAAGQAASRN